MPKALSRRQFVGWFAAVAALVGLGSASAADASATGQDERQKEPLRKMAELLQQGIGQ